MPELPEVEVVKRSLINKAQNSIIKSVKINDGKLRYKVDKNQIIDQKLNITFMVETHLNNLDDEMIPLLRKAKLKF